MWSYIYRTEKTVWPGESRTQRYMFLHLIYMLYTKCLHARLVRFGGRGISRHSAALEFPPPQGVLGDVPLGPSAAVSPLHLSEIPHSRGCTTALSPSPDRVTAGHCPDWEFLRVKGCLSSIIPRQLSWENHQM